jgi:hypothetical protein
VYVIAFCGLFTIGVIPWRISGTGCSYYVPLLVKTAVTMPLIASTGEDINIKVNYEVFTHRHVVI